MPTRSQVAPTSSFDVPTPTAAQKLADGTDLSPPGTGMAHPSDTSNACNKLLLEPLPGEPTIANAAVSPARPMHGQPALLSTPPDAPVFKQKLDTAVQFSEIKKCRALLYTTTTGKRGCSKLVYR